MSEPIADERDHDGWQRSEALRMAIAVNPQSGSAFSVMKDAKTFLAFIKGDPMPEEAPE